MEAAPLPDGRVTQSVGQRGHRGTEPPEHVDQGCAVGRHGTRHEHQPTESFGDLFSDTGEGQPGHGVADQGHAGQVAADDLLHHRGHEVTDGQGGEIAGPAPRPGRSTATLGVSSRGRSGSQHEPEKPPPWTSTYVTGAGLHVVPAGTSKARGPQGRDPEARSAPGASVGRGVRSRPSTVGAMTPDSASAPVETSQSPDDGGAAAGRTRYRSRLAGTSPASTW